MSVHDSVSFCHLKFELLREESILISLSKVRVEAKPIGQAIGVDPTACTMPLCRIIARGIPQCC